MSGLSKSVATGLRVGFVAAPAALVPAIERAIRVTTWNTPAMTTAIACRWLDDGTVGRLEATSEPTPAPGSQSPATSSPGCPWSATRRPTSPGSRWRRTPGPTGSRRSSRGKRISVATAEPYATSAPTPQALRLALGSADLDSLRRALGEVREAVEADPYR